MNFHDKDSMAGLSLTVTEHAFRLHGLIPFFRDLADQIYTASNNDAPTDSADMGVWVLKLDTLLNALSDSSDDLSEHARKAGIAAPLSWGSVVQREDL